MVDFNYLFPSTGEWIPHFWLPSKTKAKRSEIDAAKVQVWMSWVTLIVGVFGDILWKGFKGGFGKGGNSECNSISNLFGESWISQIGITLGSLQILLESGEPKEWLEVESSVAELYLEFPYTVNFLPVHLGVPRWQKRPDCFEERTESCSRWGTHAAEAGANHTALKRQPRWATKKKPGHLLYYIFIYIYRELYYPVI